MKSEIIEKLSSLYKRATNKENESTEVDKELNHEVDPYLCKIHKEIDKIKEEELEDESNREKECMDTEKLRELCHDLSKIYEASQNTLDEEEDDYAYTLNSSSNKLSYRTTDTSSIEHIYHSSSCDVSSSSSSCSSN